MATVRHFGAFPWCPWPSFEAFQKFILDAFGETSVSFAFALAFPLSAADAVTVYWRVRRWRLTGTTWFALGGNTVTPFQVNHTFPRNNIQTERDLVCWDLSSTDKLFEAVTIRVLETDILFDIQFPGTIIYGVPPMTRGVNGVDMWTTVTFGNNDQGEFPAVSHDPNAFQFGASPIKIPVNFLGKTAYIDAFQADPPDPQPINYFTPIYELTADEYWPYDPGDGGGPIYDTVTGAQLRAFP
jgi:hypothetical protein